MRRTLSAFQQTRSPRPPPPAEALRIGVADLPGRFDGLFLGMEGRRPGDDRYADGGHLLTGLDLETHVLDGPGVRADEGDARVRAGLAEFGVLGQKPVARVDGVCAHLLGKVDDAVDVEIARKGAGADEGGLVRLFHVERRGVGLGMDGHGTQPQFVAGADDPEGDLAAVGYQDFFKHQPKTPSRKKRRHARMRRMDEFHE
jgi:hypothetical protein